MSQLIPGLVSVTFRSLSPREVIDLAVKAGLQTIEWGGDIHVPPGDTIRAAEIGRMTLDAGLSIASYGSYYRLGSSEPNALSFAQVLDSAMALRTPTIRVWVGGKASDDTSAQERNAIIADALRIADLARAHGMTISLEYHAGTLTDTQDSVQCLLVEMAHPNIEFLWQPSHRETVEQGMDRLRDVLPRLRHVHVFHWWPTAFERHPLADGAERWPHYFELLRSTGRAVPCLLEFVLNDSPVQFFQDAKTLQAWLDKRAAP